MESNVENPEERRFRIDDLMAWIQTERPRLVSAALTVLRGFFEAGCPQHGQPLMGSYEAWDRVVRSACLWVGAGDPCAGRALIREEADPERDAMIELLAALRETFGSEAFTARQTVAPETQEALKVALLQFSRPGGGPPSAKDIAYVLRGWVRRVVTLPGDDGARGRGIRLVPARRNRHLAAWRVEDVEVRDAR